MEKLNRAKYRMIESDLITRVRRGVYRLNPYAYLPYQSNGFELQKEWDKLKEIKENKDV